MASTRPRPSARWENYWRRCRARFPLSTFRLGARGADETKLRERLRKVAIHEVGHVMGLPHCPHAGCVMRDAEASIATVDAETGTLCEPCAKAWLEWLQQKGN